jgi:hypothetical protein
LDVLTGADSLNRIAHTDCRTGTGGCCSLGPCKLCTVQLTVFITFRYLLILISTDLLTIRVSPISVCEQLCNTDILPLEPQLTINH